MAITFHPEMLAYLVGLNKDEYLGSYDLRLYYPNITRELTCDIKFLKSTVPCLLFTNLSRNINNPVRWVARAKRPFKTMSGSGDELVIRYFPNSTPEVFIDLFPHLQAYAKERGMTIAPPKNVTDYNGPIY